MSARGWLLGVSVSPALLLAQAPEPVPCLHDELIHVAPYTPSAEELLRMEQDRAELEAFTAEFIAQGRHLERSDYIIPVVFHIIHNNGPENISNAQVEDAIRVLNEDFNKLNAEWPNVRPEFLDLVANVGIEFRLARKDPQGNCTNGITRTVSALTTQGDQTMKNLIQWPRNRYLNVWVCADANGAAGYTYRPGPVNSQPTWDGIVLRADYTGAIGTSTPTRSHTLTHEVGHWINLAHTWGNSNSPGSDANCAMDDGVDDTPNTRGWTSCFLAGSTCDETLDNVENYMEYAYCAKMFTEGQKARMLAAVNASTAQRNQLWQPSNLAFTGVLEPAVLCQAAFSSTRNVVCAGEQVSFTDLSYNAVQAWAWSFPGAEPATSEEQHPTVTYAAPGVYPVTLVVSDGSTQATATQESYVTVLPNPGTELPFTEGFEGLSDLANSTWRVANPNGDNTWTITTAAAYSGTRSVRVQNTASMSGRLDVLTSAPFDASQAVQLKVEYRYAYARRNNSNDDKLRVYASRNCGQTWSLRQQLRGSNLLNTAGAPVSGNFVPSGPEQWGFATVSLGSMYHVPNLLIRFEFESDGGNHVYIDDINILGAPVGVHELAADMPTLRVYPNPADDQVTVVLNALDHGPAVVDLTDLAGRQVMTLHAGTLAAGGHRLSAHVHQLAPGPYMLRFIQGDQRVVVPFIKH
jgi:hypothetical protein